MAISNPFFAATNRDGLAAPANHVRAITPDSSNDLPDGVCRAICVGGAGTLDFIDAGGSSVTGFPVIVGYNPIGVKRVLTSTTATSLFALY